jgi:hypothetical protein
VANAIGSQACWLLSVIAHYEDGKQYRSPADFYNHQLMPICGLASEDALVRVRCKAIDAGWLHYDPGGKGRAGVYWVTIPSGIELSNCGMINDGNELPADDGEFTPAKSGGKAEGNPRATRGQPTGEAEGKCGTLIPNPKYTKTNPGNPFSSDAPYSDSNSNSFPPTPETGVEGIHVDFDNFKPEPLSELISAWKAVKLSGWDKPIQQTPGRRDKFTNLQRIPHWRNTWREAICIMGMSKKCLGLDKSFKGKICLDTFLKTEEFVCGVIEGNWDGHDASTYTQPKSMAEYMAELAKKRAKLQLDQPATSNT